MNFRTLDLNLLRVFDVVMAERNLTRAADQLAMTQPAVSNAIKRLRESLGDELLIRTAYGVKPTEDQVILMNGPMYHSAPSSYGMLAFRHGCTIVLEPRFDPEDLLQLVEKHRVTHMHAVPTMFVRLLKLPDSVRQRHSLKSMTMAVHAAAPCPIDPSPRSRDRRA